MESFASRCASGLMRSLERFQLAGSLGFQAATRCALERAQAPLKSKAIVKPKPRMYARLRRVGRSNKYAAMKAKRARM